MQEKLSRRKLNVINRLEESEWMSKNSTMMDMIVKYVEEEKTNKDLISTLNQVRIYKKMILPCELIGFMGRRKTREAREEKEQSCVKWKCKFCKVPKPSKKSHSLWMKFVEWLSNQDLQIIVDFEKHVETSYEVSSSGVYVKKRGENEDIIFKEEGERYGHKVHAHADEIVEENWKKTIAEMKPSGEFITYGTFHVRDEASQHD